MRHYLARPANNWNALGAEALGPRESSGDTEPVLGSMRALATSVAHEVRNPLGSLKGNVQLLADRVPAQESARLQSILHDVDRMEKVVSELLLLWRMGPWNPQLTDPGALVEEWAASARTPVRSVVEAAPGVWRLDTYRVRHALTFLLGTRQTNFSDDPTIAAVSCDADENLVIELRSDDAPAEGIHPLTDSRSAVVNGNVFAMADYVAQQHGGRLRLLAESDRALRVQLVIGRI